MRPIINIRVLLRVCTVLLLISVLAQCVSIENLTQPTSGVAGETVEIKINVKLEVEEDLSDCRLIVGFLAPLSWNVGSTASLSFTSSIGNGTLSPVPANARPVGGSLTWAETLREMFGIGGNYVADVEWVVFQTDVTTSVFDNQEIDLEVLIEPLLGTQNLTVQLGYFVGSNKYNLNNTDHYSQMFGDCFTVTDGEGQHINYCSPQISTTEPSQSTEDDFVTIFFDEDAISTALSGASEVFLCAKAHTNTGVIDLCGNGNRAAMRSAGEKRWRIDIWPRQFFGLTAGQTIDRMEYYFTDANGTKSVLSEGDTGDPFVHLFSCP